MIDNIAVACLLLLCDVIVSVCLMSSSWASQRHKCGVCKQFTAAFCPRLDRCLDRYSCIRYKSVVLDEINLLFCFDNHRLVLLELGRLGGPAACLGGPGAVRTPRIEPCPPCSPRATTNPTAILSLTLSHAL